MTKRASLVVVVYMCSFLNVFAQDKDIEIREQTWLGYFNQTRFTNRSGMWVDLHWRMTDRFVNQTALSMGRVGYTYYVSNNVRLTAGHSYITHHTSTGVDIPEHRPWQQIQWFDRKEGFSLMQYFRVEQRYRRHVSEGQLAEGYQFNHRFRYNFSFTLPLKGKYVAANTPFLFFNEEIHINAGKRIVNNYFDQNRSFLGLGYQFTSHLNAQVGYLYVFQQLAAGDRYVHVNAIRLFVFHNLDFRNKNV